MITIFETMNLNEGKMIGYAVAGVTGLIGGPFGSLNASYNNEKIQSLDSDNDFERTGKYNIHKNNRAGKGIAYEILGMIPVVGAISNILLAMDRWDKLEELEKTKQNATKIAKETGLKIRTISKN